MLPPAQVGGQEDSAEKNRLNPTNTLITQLISLGWILILHLPEMEESPELKQVNDKLWCI